MIDILDKRTGNQTTVCAKASRPRMSGSYQPPTIMNNNNSNNGNQRSSFVDDAVQAKREQDLHRLALASAGGPQFNFDAFEPTYRTVQDEDPLYTENERLYIKNVSLCCGYRPFSGICGGISAIVIILCCAVGAIGIPISYSLIHRPTYAAYLEIMDSWNTPAISDIAIVPWNVDCAGPEYFHLGPFATEPYKDNGKAQQAVYQGWKQHKICGKTESKYTLYEHRKQTSCGADEQRCGGGGCFDASVPCPITSLTIKPIDDPAAPAQHKFSHNANGTVTTYTVYPIRDEASKGGIVYFGVNTQYYGMYKGYCLGMVRGSEFDSACNYPDYRWTLVDSYDNITKPSYQYHRDVGSSDYLTNNAFYAYEQVYLFARGETLWSDQHCPQTRETLVKILKSFGPALTLMITAASFILVLLVLLYFAGQANTYGVRSSKSGANACYFIIAASAVTMYGLSLAGSASLFQIARETKLIAKSDDACTDISTRSLFAGMSGRVGLAINLMFAFWTLFMTPFYSFVVSNIYLYIRFLCRGGCHPLPSQPGSPQPSSRDVSQDQVNVEL